MIKILDGKLNIKLIVPQIYESYFNKNYIYKTVNVSAWYNNSIKKVLNIISKISVLRKIVKDPCINNIWFINTDFWIFFALCFLNTKNKKIFITNYMDYSKNKKIKDKIKNFFYEKSLRKIYKIFVSNRFKTDEKNIFIPDYYYDNRYNKYLNKKRESRVIVLGSIREDKDIIGTVKSFNKNGIPLLINGVFTSQSVLEEARTIAKSNIRIINEYPSYDEYYSLLSNSEFCLLPYMGWSYENRSSGVILESLFLRTIIIAPKFLLDFMGIKGIGYDDIKDLEKLRLDDLENEIDAIKKQNELYIKDYDIVTIQRKYINALLN